MSGKLQTGKEKEREKCLPSSQLESPTAQDLISHESRCIIYLKRSGDFMGRREGRWAAPRLQTSRRSWSGSSQTPETQEIKGL